MFNTGQAGKGGRGASSYYSATGGVVGLVLEARRLLRLLLERGDPPSRGRWRWPLLLLDLRLNAEPALLRGLGDATCVPVGVRHLLSLLVVVPEAAR